MESSTVLYCVKCAIVFFRLNMLLILIIELIIMYIILYTVLV